MIKSALRLAMGIPKIVMQTWKDRNIPDKWKDGFESVSKVMPDYKHVLMTDKDNLEFVATYFPDFLDIYRSYEHNIQRADAIRYMWLYVHGGVYMDLDYKVKHRLDELIAGCELAIGEDRPGSWFKYANMFMASAPGHPFWLDCIELMKERSKRKYFIRSLDVLMKTGPGIVAGVVKKWESSVGFRGISAKYINPCSICNKPCNNNDESFLEDLDGSSWTSSSEKLMLMMYCSPFFRILLVLVLLIPLLLMLWILFKKWKVFTCRKK
jgi:mannosyltransferase OCH1-like enzyme